MAATYVQIQRDAFENWLFTQCPVFERAEGKQGVYAIPVSDDVVLYISTSIGREDQAVAKGRGACHMKLQGRHNGQCLNRKDLGQSRFNRTTGWMGNWAKGIERMFAAYAKHSDFYDARGRETQPEYARRVRADIESIPNWSASQFFTSLYDQLTGGRWLSGKQVAIIEKQAPSAAAAPVAPQAVSVNQARVGAATQLRDQADRANDTWVANFANDMLDRLSKGIGLSTRQNDCLDRNLSKFGIVAQAA
jgi:hypothetical protein